MPVTWLYRCTLSVALVGASALLVPPPTVARDGAIDVDVELVLGVEVSCSMDDEEQHLQRNGYVEALTWPSFVLRGGHYGRIAVAYMEWAASHDHRIVVPWSLIDGPESAKAVAQTLADATYRRASRTSVAGAIDASVAMFSGNGFNGQRRVIDISGNGPNNEGRRVTAARDEAIAQGYVINGLPLVLKRPLRAAYDIENLGQYYEDCVIDGFGAFSIAVNNTKDFVAATRTKMILEIAELAPAGAAEIGPLVHSANATTPRVSCLIGEKLWQQRWGN